MHFIQFSEMAKNSIKLHCSTVDDTVESFKRCEFMKHEICCNHISNNGLIQNVFKFKIENCDNVVNGIILTGSATATEADAIQKNQWICSTNAKCGEVIKLQVILRGQSSYAWCCCWKCALHMHTWIQFIFIMHLFILFSVSRFCRVEFVCRSSSLFA